MCVCTHTHTQTHLNKIWDNDNDWSKFYFRYAVWFWHLGFRHHVMPELSYMLSEQCITFVVLMLNKIRSFSNETNPYLLAVCFRSVIFIAECYAQTVFYSTIVAILVLTRNNWFMAFFIYLVFACGCICCVSGCVCLCVGACVCACATQTNVTTDYGTEQLDIPSPPIV